MKTADEIVRAFTPLLWWALAAAATLYVLRQLKHYVSGRLRQFERTYGTSQAEKNLALDERRLALELERKTHAETVSLRQAELRHRTTETNEATRHIDELAEDRLGSKRRILEARTAAEEAQADEHVRAEHEQERSAQVSSGAEDVIEMYKRYRETFRTGMGEPRPSRNGSPQCRNPANSTSPPR